MKPILTALVLAGVVFAGQPPAFAAPLEQCGNYGYPEGYDGEKPIFTSEQIVGAGVYDIAARVARCRKARRMVRRFWAGRWGRCEPRCRRGSYRCRSTQLGDEVFKMRCAASGGRVVRFEFGA